MPVPWPALASFVAAAGTVSLVASLRRYRGKPGADWFLASLASQTVLSLAYGVALLTFDPAVRWGLEVVAWTATVATGAYFLAFAAAYTGRDRLLEGSRGVVAVAPLAAGFAVATNPLHGLVWSGFALDPVGGLATVSYALRPWTVVLATVGVLVTSLGSLLLFDTVVSYGPLYRKAAVAVGFSTIPPLAALLVWLAGLGPVPQLNFVTVAFLPHVALDAYAFLGNDMFEFHPATRRAGERAAIDDLGAPVVVVDEQRRVVTLNDAAGRAFDADRRAALTLPLTDLVGTEVALTGDATVTVNHAGDRTVYSVTATPLTDATDTHLGHTVVFQDVTAERRREQRLGVLNRVLRHNLRNDMTVVRGFAQAAAERVDDEETVAMLERATGTADGLVALGEKAREVERVLDREAAVERVALADLLADVVADYEGVNPDATVAVDAAVSVTTDPATLRAVVGTLLENALEHAGQAPTVDLAARHRNGVVEVTVADDGPGLPDHERAVVEAGDESALEHGSGLGLWLAAWGATTLGAELAFDVDDGTTAVLHLPTA